MNSVDNDINTIRTQRTGVDQGARRSGDVAGSGLGSGSASGVSTGASAESVSLTQTAAGLLALENQLKELPGIDQARVDTIRQSIDDGSYEVDAKRLVDNLIKSEQDFA